MTSIRQALRTLFAPQPPPPPGLYALASGPGGDPPYRLHLRIEQDGSGTLIVNAATVLHLNPTAAEYAYHLVLQHSPAETASALTRRYRLPRRQALEDYAQFRERLHSLLETPNLAPDLYLEFEPEDAYAHLTAPYRLDCALTYRLPEGAAPEPESVPLRRVERELSTAEWQRIIAASWEAGIPHLVFTGGEPTLRADLPDLLACAEANGQVTGLCSLGLALNDPAYRRDLLQTGLDHLLFLLHPQESASWQALENILPEDLHTTVHLTLTPQTAPLAEDSLRRLAEMGIPALSLSAAGPELHEAMSGLQDLAADLGLELKWDLPVPYGDSNPVALELAADGQPPPAGAGLAWLYVEPDGDVLPAQGVNRVLGNFLRDAWPDIWERARQAV